MALRVCRDCGKEALTESDLELFARDKDVSYGRKNLCKSCAAIRQKEWRKNHPYYCRRYYAKRINYKGKSITLDKSPRQNICSSCGKKYPEELKNQTCIHHDKYDDEDVLLYTRELCGSCHNKLRKGTHRVPLKVQKERWRAWRYSPEVKARIAENYKAWVQKKKIEDPEWWEKRRRGIPTGNPVGRPRSKGR